MIKPLNDNVVLKKEHKEEEKKTISGIIISSKKEESEYAVVVAVGPGKLDKDNKRIKPCVNVGDKVIYKNYSPTKVKVDDAEYLIISADDILAVLE